MNYPKRLQGTDGIRGKTLIQLPPDQIALDYFLTEEFLTPQFFESYCYAYGCLLLEKRIATQGSSIVIGWDPRDQSGEFNQAAIRGIQKTGLNAILVGILPTPAIPLYMLTTESVGSLVLTASHNPSDQNGIKLFCGFTGLKLLPGDDEALTQKIVEQRNLNFAELPLLGSVENHEELAKQAFIQYCTNPKNSWFQKEDLSKIILVIDASKGAATPIVEEIFSQFPFHSVHYTNCSIQGDVNENSGVADLEGREKITSEEILTNTAFFHQYETLQKIYSLAETEEVQKGELKIIGLVFDGDADRCFQLNYQPTEKEVLISSGDTMGFFQAQYLSNKDQLGWFVNTVESDLSTAIEAQKLGFESIITGVGDKWILLRAVVSQIQTIYQNLDLENVLLEKQIQEIQTNTKPCALELSHTWSAFSKKIDFQKIPFQLGLEESGHCLTVGEVETPQGMIPFFSGNGIKTGINSIVATENLFSNLDSSAYYKKIQHPFPEGVKSTNYTYYVDKTKLNPNSTFRKKLEFMIPELVKTFFGDSWITQEKIFTEEDTMIYFELIKENSVKGAIFIRNSGTEDKTALYVRGQEHLLHPLNKIIFELQKYLLLNIKKFDHSYVAFELEILEALKNKTDLDLILEKYKELPTSRILKEMELKEKVIQRSNQLQLSDLGEALIENAPF